MKLSIAAVRRLCRERELSISRLLARAGVSRTAFYSLARRESVLPKTVRDLAHSLGVSELEILETPPAPDRAIEAKLRRARRISSRSPGADFRNIWHTLTLLELPAVERLERSLLRGRSKHLQR